MGAIANDWLEPLKPEFAKPYYAQLYKKVKEEYTTHQIFPPSDMIFHAFEVTPLEDVKVVILGQDPYHGMDRHMDCVFPFSLRWRSRRHWKTSTRNCRMISDAIFQITAILRNGRNRVCCS